MILRLGVPLFLDGDQKVFCSPSFGVSNPGHCRALPAHVGSGQTRVHSSGRPQALRMRPSRLQFVCALIVLCIVYMLFMKKFYHLHEEYLVSLKD